MAMTFTGLTAYQLDLLFSSWTITTRGQFTIAWFLVCIAVMVYHLIRYLVTILEREMSNASESYPHETLQQGPRDALDPNAVNSVLTNSKAHSASISSATEHYNHSIVHGHGHMRSSRLVLKIMHALLTSFHFGVRRIYTLDHHV